MAYDAQVLTKKYETQSISTACPEKCVVMLYERLVDDLECGKGIFDSPNFKPAFDAINHAVQIIRFLRAAIRTDIWPEGANLISLYNWFEKELTDAVMFQDRSRLEACLPLVRQLAETWKTAAEKVMDARGSDTQTNGYAFAETRNQIADFLA